MKRAILSLSMSLAACGGSATTASDAATATVEVSVGDTALSDAAPDVAADAAPSDAEVEPTADVAADAASDLDVAATAGLTADFRAWLAAHQYDVADLARDDLTGGSFGGRAHAGEALAHDPVIFIHGNSDKALGTAIAQTGWTASRAWFLQHGYTDAELYATTWGPADAAQAAQQEHSRKNIQHLRKFVEAVLAYTGAQKVDIVAHSMGVTLARKVVLGGSASDPGDGGAYAVGAPLTDHVDAFVGIAGANLGLTSCFLTGPTTPTCSAGNGLYPGALVGLAVAGRSAYLTDLLQTSGYEGGFRYALWSTMDEIIGYADIVYGQPTSRLPGQTAEVTFATAPYGHFGLKDLTADVQLALVRDHQTP